MKDFLSNCLENNASDQEVCSLPEDYENSCKVTNETQILLNEIFSNISSNSAKFDGPYGNRKVIYCDYAASGQSLNFIEDYIRNNVLPFYGNTHTTTTATSLQSTHFRREAKDIIRKTVNASEYDAVIFAGSGCTGAVNKLIRCLNFKFPVIVFVGPYEHHSNLLPWREIASKVVRIKETLNGLIDTEHLETELKKYYGKNRHLIGSFSAASNVTGILSDDITISVLLHKYGALAFWDYATAGPHVNIQMNPLTSGQDEGLAYKDAVFLSPHKFVGGPDTPGVLIAKKTIFGNYVPSEPGGGTVFFVSRNSHRYLKDIEMREEGGTPSIIGAIRAGMAIQLKEAVTFDVIRERDTDIVRMVMEKLKAIPELKLLGNNAVPRLPIFSFMIYHSNSGFYLHHNFVCALLNDMFGIQTRSGCACAGPYAFDLLGIDETLAQQFASLLAENSCLDRTHLHRKSQWEILRPGFVRLTFSYFMPNEEIEFIVNSVSMLAVNGWKELPQYSFNPETGEWKHNDQQSFIHRKSLDSISYKTGTFMVKENEVCAPTSPNSLEVLEAAKQCFQKSEKVALEIKIPDPELIFDVETSKFRWFLLPNEAKQYLLGELNTKIKNPIFIIRDEGKTNLINTNEAYIFVNTSKISRKDEKYDGCNISVTSSEMRFLKNSKMNLKRNCNLL